jgi:hypothetical protein
MRYIEPHHIDFVIANNVLDRCLAEARKRAQGAEISFSGFERRWEDCLTYFSDSEGSFLFTFYYNIGENTSAVNLRISKC